MEYNADKTQLTKKSKYSCGSCTNCFMLFWRSGRRARRRWKVFFVSFGVFMALAITYLILKKYNYICYNEESEKVIEQVCEYYKRGDIGGTICQDFCDSNPNISGYSCFPFHHFSKMVATAYWNGKEVIIKGDVPIYLPDRRDYEPKEKYPYRLKGRINQWTTGIIMNDDQLREHFLWYSDLLDKWGDTETISWWTSLSTSREFFAFSILRSLNLVPEMLGFCGTFRAEEKLSPVPYRTVAEAPRIETWIEDLKLAQKFLQLVRVMDSGLMGEKSIIYCDVKMEHFGIDEKGGLKIVDGGDLLFKERQISKHVNKACYSHSECQYLSCYGICDLETNKCANDFASDNLQMICEKVFLGLNQNVAMLTYRGLLVNRYASNDLRSLLNECAGVGVAAGNSIRASEKGDLQEKLENEINRALKVAGN